MRTRTGQPSRDRRGVGRPRGGDCESVTSGHIFRFAYGAPVKEFLWRDSDAFVELVPLLFDGKRAYGGGVLNGAAPENHDPSVIIPVGEDFLTPSDLLVLTTRPPLHDLVGDRKYIPRSYTSLEWRVFGAVQHHLVRCSRSYVQLSPCLREAFPAETANRAHVEYRVHGRFASYKARRDYRRGRWDDGDDRRTGAYLIYKKSAWPGGPDLLVVFSMNRIQTLLWAHCLGTRPEFANVLARPRFLMAEIELQDIPPEPKDLRFSDDWKIETLLDYPLDRPDDGNRPADSGPRFA